MIESSRKPFRELPVSQQPFEWRGQGWIKTSRNHAIPTNTDLPLPNQTLGVQSVPAPEHIPSHDEVHLLQT